MEKHTATLGSTTTTSNLARKYVDMKPNQYQNTENDFDAQTLYNRVRHHVIIDTELNRKVINLLKYCERLLEKFREISSPNGQVCTEYLHKFQTVLSKINERLSSFSVPEAVEAVRCIREPVARIIGELQSKTVKYQESQQQLRQAVKQSRQLAESMQDQDEEMQEEMLQLMGIVKNHAIEIGVDLKRDSGVISQIDTKQSDVLASLKNKNKTMSDIISKQGIGFWELIMLAIIGIALWIFGLFVILIF